jgi:hypothetical protein
MRSVHDNHILRYSVDARLRTIRIETEYPHSIPPERTDLIFEGVQAYFFEHDLFESIILDLEKAEIGFITQEFRELFENGARHGWPLGWQPKKETITEYFTRLELSAFVLSASYGMDGWIICKEMKQDES